MGNTESREVVPIDPDKDVGVLSALVEWCKEFTDIPPALTRNVGKAVAHLMKIPGAWIDGKAAEIQAASEARVVLTKATSASIAKQIDVDPSVAQIAADTQASKILRQTVNTASVLRFAAEEIKAPSSENTPDVVKEITDDWLNAFEQEAVNMSSERMQRLFGKILAGEVRRPTTFSIRTVKLMAQLDNRPAELFRTLCSLSIVIKAEGQVVDARVVAVGNKSAGSNGLKDYGLSFNDLNILFEYGLIISDYHSTAQYFFAVLGEPNGIFPVRYMNKSHGFKPLSKMSPDDLQKFSLSGVALSQTGKELLSIVHIEENPAYTSALTEHLRAKGFELVPLNTSN